VNNIIMYRAKNRGVKGVLLRKRVNMVVVYGPRIHLERGAAFVANERHIQGTTPAITVGGVPKGRPVGPPLIGKFLTLIGNN